MSTHSDKEEDNQSNSHLLNWGLCAILCLVFLLLGLALYENKKLHSHKAQNNEKLIFISDLYEGWYGLREQVSSYLETPNQASKAKLTTALQNLDLALITIVAQNDRLFFFHEANIQINMERLQSLTDKIATLLDQADKSQIDHRDLLQYMLAFDAELRPLYVYKRQFISNQNGLSPDGEICSSHSWMTGGGVLALLFVLFVILLRCSRNNKGLSLHLSNVMTSGVKEGGAIEGRKREVLETSPDGIMITNEDGLIEYLNPMLLSLLSDDQNDLEGEEIRNHVDKPWYSIFTTDQQLSYKQKVLPVIKDTGTWQGDITMDADGAKRMIELSLRALPMGGMMGVFRDMTEQKKSEREAAELRKQFFQAQKMESIGRLTGGIAHDFNNILSAIMGYAEFLEEDLPPNTAEAGFANKIITASKQAKSLINRILSFSRKNNTEKVPVDLHHLLQVTYDMIGSSSSDGIEIRIQSQVKEAYILGNPTEISQVMMNLSVNARDAMEEVHGKLGLLLSEALFDEADIKHFDKIDLDDDQQISHKTHIVNISSTQTCVYAGAYDPNLEYYAVKIVDSGTGILPGIIEQIFEPFFTTKDQDKGTGLGLSSSLGIIVGHKGLMKVNSTIGEGTSFSLYFPKECSMDWQGNDDQDHIAIHADDSQPTVTGASQSTGKKRILLVDDDDNVRETVILMLKRMGYDVDDFSSPLLALEHAEKYIEDYDLLMTDYIMPEMKGGALAEKINVIAPDLPVIVISGFAEDAFENEWDDLPYIKAFLHKPLDKKSMQSHLSEILG